MTEPKVKEIRRIFTYHYNHTIPTNISRDYLTDSGTNWGEWEMLRETLQNAMDEAQYMAEEGASKSGVVGDWEDRLNRYSYNFQLADFCKVSIKNGDRLHIADMGRGVDLEQVFIVGESGKRGSRYRGEKGEGELLSFLVAARLGIEKWMFSKDWAITARFDAYNGSKYNVLVVDVYKTSKPRKNNLSKKQWGTIWEYQLTPELESYYDNLYDKFPELSRQRVKSIEAASRREDAKIRNYAANQGRAREKKIRSKSTASSKCIFKPREGNPARLYHQGIWVKDLDDAIFSYNIRYEWGIKIGRDRSMVDDFELLDAIELAFNSDDFSYAMAVTYWETATNRAAATGLLEFRRVVMLDDTKKDIFKRAFYKVSGKKSCISTDAFYSVDVRNMGWKVVNMDTNAIDMALSIGIKTDLQITGNSDGIRYAKQLSVEDVRRMDLLEAIARELGFKAPECKIALAFKMDGHEKTNNPAIYNTVTKTIVILQKAFRGSPVMLLGHYLHELGHHDTKAIDASRKFQNWFADQWVKFMLSPNSKITELCNELVYGDKDD